MRFRFAIPDDAGELAPMNAQLIRDEGHRNSMSVAQLAERMRVWLGGEYRAVFADGPEGVLGYALYRREPEFTYLRQLFVRPELRRRGIGREFVGWLCSNVAAPNVPLRVEVLIGNVAAQAFWRSVGFADYCITLERPFSNAP
jgi:GNAT superfamily N-acetyltransferase